MVQHSLKATRDGLMETRRAIQSLRATPLEDLGLVRGIRELAEGAAGRSGFRLNLDLPEDIEGLPPEVEQCFYRIAQEAIENAAKHSRAHSFGVKLSRSVSGLELEIADDGAGFDPQDVETGRRFGLQGMRERAGLISAVLEISSHRGKGTTLRLAWSGESQSHGGRG